MSFVDLFISSVCMFFYFPFFPKNIWIISERGDQAQDNGISFFKYLNSIDDDISSYYLLEKGNENIKRVGKIGKVILKGSLKHKMFFLMSNVIASTEKNIIEPWGSNIFYKYFSSLYPQKIKVFLQHGVTDKDVSHVYGRKISNFDLVVTVSKREKKFMVEQFGYDESNVICTGFSRYDYLNLKSKNNIITYIPTWRRYLVELSDKSISNTIENKDNFLKSKYYLEIMDIINDSALISFLEEENLEFLFITHYAFDIFSELFSSKSDKIKIFKSGEIEIKSLLEISKIFITDYSSIHFDSAYIGCNNIYYQFDVEEFFDEHAGKSYFSYEIDGFGDLVNNKFDLIKVLDEIASNNYVRKKMYCERVNKFFEFKDKNNSKRIYDEVKSFLK